MKSVPKPLLQRMLKDLDFYGAGCLKIRDKQANIKTFRMNDAQKIVHEKLAKQYKDTGRVRAIILKARQEGVSTYTAARFFRRLHLMPNQEALIVAHEKDPAQTLFGIYDRFHAYLPPEMQPMVRYTAKQTQLVLDNPDDKTRGQNPGLGSKVSIETANDPALARGSTIQLIHASEMAFWAKPEDAWISMNQAMPDSNSELIVESTANGVGNFFHQLWQSAEEGANGFLPIFLPWWIDQQYSLELTPAQAEFVEATLSDQERDWMRVGFDYEGEQVKLTLEQVAWRRQTIRDKLAGDERLFRQEYPATADEAFLVSGNCFFDEDKLKAYSDVTKKPKFRANMQKLGSGVIAKRGEKGYLRVWLLPGEKIHRTDKEPRYVIGADTAMGRQVAARQASLSDPDQERGGRDFSSADVFDAANRRQVAQLHGRMAPEVFAAQLAMLGRFYSTGRQDGSRDPALVAVEKNHMSGETVLRILQQFYRYPRLHFSRQMNRRREAVKEVLGWQTTVETRMPMLDELAQAIREENVWLPNKDSIKEMFTFVRGEDGKPQAQEGTHDDRVISLAIALQMSRYVSLAPTKHFNETEQPVQGDSPTGMFTYG